MLIAYKSELCLFTLLDDSAESVISIGGVIVLTIETNNVLPAFCDILSGHCAGVKESSLN